MGQHIGVPPERLAVLRRPLADAFVEYSQDLFHGWSVAGEIRRVRGNLRLSVRPQTDYFFLASNERKTVSKDATVTGSREEPSPQLPDHDPVERSTMLLADA